MRNVRIIVTNACNASTLQPQDSAVCGFCYRHTDKMIVDPRMVKTVFSELRQFPQIQEAVLTGGEPLLSEHVGNAANYARQAGLYVTIHTNGILLKRRIEDLAAADCISIPVDGSEPRIADHYRGRGFYHIATDCLQTLKSHGKEIGINTFVSSRNVDDLENIARLISGHKPRYWFISEFRGVNAASHAATREYILAPGTFIKQVEAVKARHPEMPIFYQERSTAFPPRVWLRLDGKVYANTIIDGHNEEIGDLKTSRLQEMLKSRGLSL